MAFLLRFQAAATKAIEQDLGIEVGDLRGAEVDEDFVKSPEDKERMKARKKWTGRGGAAVTMGP